MTNQVQDTSWVVLVFSPFSKKEQTCAGLTGVRRIPMAYVCFFVADIRGQAVRINRVVAKPEEFL